MKKSTRSGRSGAKVAIATTLAVYALSATGAEIPLDGAPALDSSVSEVQEVQTAAAAAAAAWDFWNLEPSESLNWQPCWDDDYQCARLSVPLNWNDKSDSARANIALIKLPARVPVTDPRYAGVILSNPGGPGVSGIAQIATGGKHVQTLADSPFDPKEDKKEGLYYDIIGFDPRGVNNTTPKLSCFPNRLVEESWKHGAVSGRFLDEREFDLNYEWARLQASGQACAQQRGKQPNAANYVNTAQVVEDVRAIIEAHGEWRQKEAERLLKDKKDSKAMKRAEWKKGKEMLNYWGFSYGTTLGQTFMGKYPERVGRVVLDGVSDAKAWYDKDTTASLQDTDQIVHQMGEYCVKAGSKCPFFTEGQSSKSFYMEKIMDTIDKFKKEPLAVDTPYGPIVISHDDIMDLLELMLYEPLVIGALFTQIVKELNQGNILTIAAILPASQDRSLTAECKRDGPYSPSCTRSQSTTWISDAVACADSIDLTGLKKGDYLEYLEDLQEMSQTMGSSRSATRKRCINWPARPAWEPKVNLSAKTANTVLVLANTYDTVTPLAFAKKATGADMFPNSRLLEIKIEGHCSIASPVLCVGKAVQTFFQTGEVPKKGAVCEADWKPWLGCVKEGGCEGEGKEEKAIQGAVMGMTREWSLARLAGFSVPNVFQP